MNYSYRITKYFESNTSGNLISNENEWTSFSDVGENVSLEEYLKVENAYLVVITFVCEHFHISELKVIDLEIINYDRSIVNGQLLTIESASELSRNILREEVWCKLASTDIEFHFGYDFYMYLVSNMDIYNLLEKTEFAKILNIQKYKSPYL